MLDPCPNESPLRVRKIHEYLLHDAIPLLIRTARRITRRPLAEGAGCRLGLFTISVPQAFLGDETLELRLPLVNLVQTLLLAKGSSGNNRIECHAIGSAADFRCLRILLPRSDD